jgi:hypothetical protein
LPGVWKRAFEPDTHAEPVVKELVVPQRAESQLPVVAVVV